MSSLGSGRRPGIIAAIALVLLGSLFPKGYMPVNDNGRITIALCSAYGAQSITLDLGRKSPPRQHTGSSNCQGVFTGLGLVPTATPLPLPAAAWPEPAPQSLPRFAVSRLHHFDPNAPPQAPPALI